MKDFRRITHTEPCVWVQIPSEYGIPQLVPFCGGCCDDCKHELDKALRHGGRKLEDKES